MSLTKILDALDPVFQRTLGATFPAAGVVVPRATSIEYMLGDRRATAAAPARRASAPVTSAIRIETPTTGTLRTA